MLRVVTDYELSVLIDAHCLSRCNKQNWRRKLFNYSSRYQNLSTEATTALPTFPIPQLFRRSPYHNGGDCR